MSDNLKIVIADFKAVISMTARQIDWWLDTDESKAIGFKEGEAGEPVGQTPAGSSSLSLASKRRITRMTTSGIWPSSSATLSAT